MHWLAPGCSSASRWFFSPLKRNERFHRDFWVCLPQSLNNSPAAKKTDSCKQSTYFLSVHYTPRALFSLPPYGRFFSPLDEHRRKAPPMFTSKRFAGVYTYSLLNTQSLHISWCFKQALELTVCVMSAVWCCPPLPATQTQKTLRSLLHFCSIQLSRENLETADSAPATVSIIHTVYGIIPRS